MKLSSNTGLFVFAIVLAVSAKITDLPVASDSKQFLGGRGAYNLTIGMSFKDVTRRFACVEVNIIPEEVIREKAEEAYRTLHGNKEGGSKINPLNWFSDDKKDEKQEFIRAYVEEVKSVRNFYVTKDSLPKNIRLIQCTFKNGRLYYIFIVGDSEQIWTQWQYILEKNFGMGRKLVHGVAMSLSWENDDIGIILGKKNNFYMLSYTDLSILKQEKKPLL